MTELLARLNSPAKNWALIGAVIGGVLIPFVAILADPFIPDRGWMFPEVFRLSFLPGAIVSGWLVLLLELLVPSIQLFDSVYGHFGPDGGNSLWIVVSAPLNAAIYSFMGYILWKGTHGLKWLLVIFAILVMMPWFILNIMGLFLVS